MNSARHHTDGVHSDNTPTESMFETPQTFAAKLCEIGYVEPVANKPRQQFICITMGCQAVSDRPGACDKCQSDIARGKFDGTRWEKILAWSLVAFAIGVSAALIWKALA